MNNEIIRKGRFQQKCDTTENWAKANGNFTPKKGEIIIYQDYDENKNPLPPKYKSGDGNTDISELPFSSAGIELGEGQNGIQQSGTDSAAIGEDAIALGRGVIAKGNGTFATGESGNSIEQLKNHSKYPFDIADKTDEEIISAWDVAHTRRITGVEKDSTAAGLFSIALGNNSYVEGESTLANNAGHAQGRRTRATGSRAHSQGTDTAALGNNSHAEGQDSQAVGWASHAEGYGTIAGRGSNSGDSDGAHAEGAYTKALATATHAEGTYTEARATASHTEGAGTIATQNYQHVQGKYNYLDANGDAGDYAHIIGGGINADNRTNIHTVDWSGNAWYKGTIEAGNGKFQEVSGTKGTFSGDVLAGSVSLQYVNKKIAASYADPSRGNEGGVKMLGATSSSRYGLACGYRCQSNGDHAMSFGAGLIAKGTQVVVGLYNKEISGATFIVGAGASEAEADRKNVFVVKSNGTGYLSDKRILVEGDIPTIPTDPSFTSITIDGVRLTKEKLQKLLAIADTMNIEL